MIIDNNVTEVEFNKLNAGDYAVITTSRRSTYRLTVYTRLYTDRGLVVSTIVKIEKTRLKPLLGWQELGFGIITSVKEGRQAVFAEAAGYKYPLRHASWMVESLTLYYNPRLNARALRWRSEPKLSLAFSDPINA